MQCIKCDCFNCVVREPKLRSDKWNDVCIAPETKMKLLKISLYTELTVGLRSMNRMDDVGCALTVCIYLARISGDLRCNECIVTAKNESIILLCLFFFSSFDIRL